MLEEVTACYVRMAYEIASHEPLLIVTPERTKVETLLKEKLPAQVFAQIRWADCPTDDTWARDHGFITLIDETGPLLLDFCFNGWGKKFSADQDNRINRGLMKQGILNGTYTDHLDFVLEGGSIESDGHGTLLTTSECLLSANRNDRLNRADIEERLKSFLHVERVLWLDHGYLSGDDTDSHIDTLARFCPRPNHRLREMRGPYGRALRGTRTHGRTASHVPHASGRTLPARRPAHAGSHFRRRRATASGHIRQFPGGQRSRTDADLPSARLDEQARKALQKAFPQHEVVGIDCRPLIRQHGSLHCCTMQFPVPVLK